MDDIREFFKRDTFAEHLGIQLVALAPGYAKATMKLTAKHLNGVDVAHGGAIFSLADLVFAAASNSHGTVAVAINANIHFLKGAVQGAILTAEAKEVSLHPKLGTYAISVTDDKSNLIATFQGMVYRKADKLSDLPPRTS
jgi:acyl-CoA thioesterase